MNNIKKILIIPFSMICCCLNFSSALPDGSDCGIFASQSFNKGDGFTIINGARETNTNQYSNFLTINQQTGIITRMDLNIAMINLKKYCCENEKGGLKMKSTTCQDDKDYFNENALDSPYLFDHIFDIMMRRLNGLTGENDIYKNMTVDPKGKERRNRISNKAEDLSGSDSQTIIDKYIEFRQPKPEFDIANEIDGEFQDDYQNFLSYVSGIGETLDDGKKVSEALKKYNERSLYERYTNVCALSEYFYSLLAITSIRETEDKSKIINNLSNGTCNNIVMNQIYGENRYVQLVNQRASNLFSENHKNGYISYLYGRQSKLLKLWKDSSDRRLGVIRAVPGLVHTSVK